MEEKKLRIRNIYKVERNEFFNVMMIYLTCLLLFIGVRIFANAGIVDFGNFSDLIYALIIQVGIMFVCSGLMYKNLQKKTFKEMFKDFRFVKISWKAILICVALGILLIFINFAINSIYGIILQIFGYAPATVTISEYPLVPFLIAIFSSAVLPAFCEEFLNRGIVLRGLRNSGLTKAIIISGLLFGLMHLNIGQFGFAFVIGMLYAFICIATGSIFPTIILHFLNNGILEYITFARINNLPFGNFYNSLQIYLTNNDPITTILLVFLAISVILFLFVWLVYLLIKETRLKKLQKIGNDLADTFAKESEDIRPKSIKVDIPLSVFDIQLKQKYHPSLITKIPLYAIIFLSSTITIMSLIWGAL